MLSPAKIAKKRQWIKRTVVFLPAEEKRARKKYILTYKRGAANRINEIYLNFAFTLPNHIRGEE